MTGQEAFRQALRLLGYTDTLGQPDSGNSAEAYKRALAVVNQIAAELGTLERGELPAPMLTLAEPVPLSERCTREILPYGIAMLLAASRSDTDNLSLFSALYHARRTAASTRYERRHDTLPRGCSA